MSAAAGTGPVLVVHGGAGNLESAEDRRLYLQGVDEALRAGLAELERGAREAVLAAVTHMEAHTIMNAGRGAALAQDGTAALDAGYMDGASKRFGGVTGVRNCVHAVLLAERVSARGEHGRLLAPPDVDGLAAAFGIAECEPSQLVTERAKGLWQRRREAAARSYLDTVGAVALDAEGHVAAAVSTGGTSLKPPGRIGDSPVVGAGYWAEDGRGACVTTGVGEALLRSGLARRAVQLLSDGTAPEHAVRRALDEMLEGADEARCAAGLILVAADGAVVLDHHSPEMSGGWVRPGGAPEVRHLWRAT
ncbi:MAG: isoaspartyl peptidase/L-asparaginase [Planctomycetota bacterium]